MTRGGSSERRVRVWELARATGLPSADVRRRLAQLGWPTTSAASAVTSEAADALVEAVTPLPAVPDREGARGYRELWPYVASRRSGWFRVLVATIASSAVGLMLPWPLKLLADNALAEGRTTGWLTALPFTDDVRVTVAYLGLATLLLFALASALEVWLTTTWVRVGSGMVYQLAGDVLRALQAKSLLFHARTPIGDSLSRIMVDSFGVGGVVNAVLFAPLHALVMITGMLVVLSQLDGLLTVVAVLVSLSMTLASRRIGRSIHTIGRVARDAESALQSHVHHVLTGVSIVQAFGQERREHQRFLAHADKVVRARRRGAVLGQVGSLGSGLPEAVGTAVVLFLGVSRVLSGEMSVGTLLVFLAYLSTLTNQISTLTKVNESVQGTRAQVDRVLEVTGSQPEVAEHPRARDLPRVRGHVAFEDVRFRYEPDRWALDGVTFEVRPGETVAVVGPSGAGKTTLAGLVTRFFDVASGRVLIDGHDVRDVKLHQLRAQVGMVLQDPFLFPVSIADNIAYGRPGASRAQVEDAARAANAHAFICALPDGYDTMVGERGGTLSGGQRQRISIARAFLKDAPVLVLDEPTSALDTASESALLGALDQLMVGRSTLIIAHRLTTVRGADRILVMEDGRVVEQGTHGDLLAAGGAYARLHAVASRRRTRRAR